MRQFRCIEVGLQDAMTLSDILRPLAPVAPYDQSLMVRLCEKLYGAILRLRIEDPDGLISIPIEEHEAIFLNHFVGSQDWGGAEAVLEQTWLALYELQHESVYPRPRETIAASIVRLGAGSSVRTTPPDEAA
jgi:hypothetical protein